MKKIFLCFVFMFFCYTGFVFGQEKTYLVQKTFQTNQIIQIDETKPIYSLMINGNVSFFDFNSLIRIILQDTKGNEYLVYETYPLVEFYYTFSFIDNCEESCSLPGIKPKSLIIQIQNGYLSVDSYRVKYASTRTIKSRAVFEQKKLAVINQNLRTHGFLWVAGETEFSKLSYAQKKKRLSFIKEEELLPNLNGLEYYKGGFFSTTPPSSFTSTSRGTLFDIPDEFSWRTQHGIDWSTSAKDQGGCLTCQVFAVVSTFEAYINLYYNQKIDTDLSEQQLIFCNTPPGSGCSTSFFAGHVLDNIATNGLIDEACFPYTATDGEPCTPCAEPTERFYIENYFYTSTSSEEDIKRLILEYGPTSSGFYTWAHAVLFLGFGLIEEGDYTEYCSPSEPSGFFTVTEGHPAIGETYWEIKNSWGTSWGVNGYGYIIAPSSNIGYIWNIEPPVTNTITTHEIQCTDRDNDGYYFWGVSELMPSSCPSGIPTTKDCNDGNSLVAEMDADFNCLLTIPGYVVPDVTCIDYDGDGFYYWGSLNPKPDTCPQNARDEIDCNDTDPGFGKIKSDNTCDTFYPDYVISVIGTEGGRITPSGKIFVEDGETISFNIHPEDGYYTSHIFANQEVIDNTITTYTFNNVHEDKILTVIFQQGTE